MHSHTKKVGGWGRGESCGCGLEAAGATLEKAPFPWEGNVAVPKGPANFGRVTYHMSAGPYFPVANFSISKNLSQLKMQLWEAAKNQIKIKKHFFFYSCFEKMYVLFIFEN